MKKVTKYESKDGHLFDTEKACLQHESTQVMLHRIEEELYLRDVSSEEIWEWIRVNIKEINKVISDKVKS